MEKLSVGRYKKSQDIGRLRILQKFGNVFYVILDIAIYKLCIYSRKNKDQILVFYVISSIDIYKLYAYSRKT